MRTSRQVATDFVDLIHAQDLDGLIAAVTERSRFFVEGESPTVGREKLRAAWSGYFAAFPGYLVFVDEVFERSDAIYLVGHTSGSHVPPELERIPSSVIWRCEVFDQRVAEWSVFPGSEVHRERFALGPAPV